MDFYDNLSPLYHLMFPDWDDSMQLQGEQLNGVIQAQWPGCQSVLDLACGIGTQSLALAGHGYAVTGSDLSEKSVQRARREAALRSLPIQFSQGDMRDAPAQHGSGHALVMACDNALPHLLDDAALLAAFKAFYACLRPGGGCLITVRDYAREERASNLLKHYGVRVESGHRYVLYQIWDFVGEHYDLGFYVVDEHMASGAVQTHVMRSRYYAISVERLCQLMAEAGFERVQRLDEVFYQPVIVGTRPR